MLKKDPTYLLTKLRGYFRKSGINYKTNSNSLTSESLGLIFTFSSDWPGYIIVQRYYEILVNYFFCVNNIGQLIVKLLRHGLINKDRFIVVTS